VTDRVSGGSEFPELVWPQRPETNHPLVEAAGTEGRLPDWAYLDAPRRAHSKRVAGLMDRWGAALGLDDKDRVRWRAAAELHDAMKSYDPGELRIWAGPGLPDPVLHGPACADRLRSAGVDDEELLLAIAFHSTGHPDLGELGEFLYLADYLEPGRKIRSSRLPALRARLPGEREAVLTEVLAMRIGHLLDKRRPVLQATMDFWNRLMGESSQ
jgi:HD superfamily phosphohydrolase YqeK